MIGKYGMGEGERNYKKSALEQKSKTHSHKPIKESAKRERVSQSNESKGRMFKKNYIKNNVVAAIFLLLLFCRCFFACNDTHNT